MLSVSISLDVFENIGTPRILITGAEGQLGSELSETLSGDYDVVAVDKKDFDISDFKAANNFITNCKFHPRRFNCCHLPVCLFRAKFGFQWRLPQG
ncbi:MAG: sugar nucleotide-binding protein [candidate division WOR-3 bacterium]